jgi:hypothetical protein
MDTSNSRDASIIRYTNNCRETSDCSEKCSSRNYLTIAGPPATASNNRVHERAGRMFSIGRAGRKFSLGYLWSGDKLMLCDCFCGRES